MFEQGGRALAGVRFPMTPPRTGVVMFQERSGQRRDGIDRRLFDERRDVPRREAQRRTTVRRLEGVDVRGERRASTDRRTLPRRSGMDRRQSAGGRRGDVRRAEAEHDRRRIVVA